MKTNMLKFVREDTQRKKPKRLARMILAFVRFTTEACWFLGELEKTV